MQSLFRAKVKEEFVFHGELNKAINILKEGVSE